MLPLSNRDFLQAPKIYEIPVRVDAPQWCNNTNGTKQNLVPFLYFLNCLRSSTFKSWEPAKIIASADSTDNIFKISMVKPPSL
jgi:hypothetical protein